MRGRKVRKEKAEAGEMESGEFAELILKGLIDEGYCGYELLDGHLFSCRFGATVWNGRGFVSEDIVTALHI